MFLSFLHGLVVYSPTRRLRGASVLIFKDNRHAMANDKRISPTPATVIKTMGILNVHLTMPRLPKNSAVSGFMMRLHTMSPTTVEIIIAGINERAVCKTSCLVVKPSDFKIP